MTIDRDGSDSFSSSVLPDDLKDLGVPYDLDDEVEVSLVDDETVLEPRRGQNEDQYASEDEDGLGDIENPKIKDRIMRERRLRMESERRNSAETERMELALLNSEKQKVQVQADSFKLAIDSVDVRIRTAREALKAARIDGDVNAEEDLKANLDELANIRRGIESNMARLPSEAALDAAYRDHVNARRSRVQQPASRSDGDVRPLNEKAGRWAQQNPWVNDRSRVAEQAALLAVNNALVQEGYDPNDDDFFVEMSKRLHKSLPSLGVKTLDGRALGGMPGRPQRQSSAPPVASARSSAPPSPNGRSRARVELDGSDRRMMRMLGIDVSDKAAVSRFAKEKLARQRNEQMGR